MGSFDHSFHEGVSTVKTTIYPSQGKVGQLPAKDCDFLKLLAGMAPLHDRRKKPKALQN